MVGGRLAEDTSYSYLYQELPASQHSHTSVNSNFTTGLVIYVI